MAETEHRRVETEFTAHTGGAVSSVGHLQHALVGAVEKVEKLHHHLAEFKREQGLTTLSALGLGYGIGSWVEKIREANAEFGKAKKGIAGVLSTALEFPKGTAEVDRFTRAMDVSQGIAEKLDETAARFGFSGMEGVTDIYKKLAISAGDLGLTQKQVLDLTEETAATAKRYGVDGAMAASTIARALRTGAVRGVDEFSLSLGKAIGNMRKLTEAQRFDHISKALHGSVQIADAMSQGIGDQLARARNAVEDLLRDATSPLFKAIAGDLKQWADRLRETKENMKPLVEQYAGKLVDAFRTLQSISGFIHEHWKAIAAVAAGLKLEGALGAGGALAGLGKVGIPGMEGTVGGFMGKLATATIALGAFKVALDGILDLAAAAHDRSMTAEQRKSSLLGDLATLGALAKGHGVGGSGPSVTPTGLQAAMLEKRVGVLEKAGLLTTDAAGHRAADPAALAKFFNEGLTSGAAGSFDAVRKAFPGFDAAAMSAARGPGGSSTKVSEAQANVVTQLVNQLLALTGPAASKAKTEDLKFSKRPAVNINGGVHVTMKFEDEDPDAVFVTLKNRFEDYVDKRTQSAYSEPLGD